MNKKLTLSKKNKILAGVCGGIADYFNVDVTLVRIICIILSFVVMQTIPIGIILYLLCWAIMPRN